MKNEFKNQKKYTCNWFDKRSIQFKKSLSIQISSKSNLSETIQNMRVNNLTIYNNFLSQCWLKKPVRYVQNLNK